MSRGVRYICKECGTKEVLFDAYVRWDEEAQNWVIVNTFDDAICDECGGECIYEEEWFDIPEKKGEGGTETRRILLENGFTRNPNTFFNCFSGEYMKIERWNNQVTKPNNKSALGWYEGINPTDTGFELWFSHGRLDDPSVLRFPKYATELDYKGAFDRLMNFIKANYEYEPGLPAFMFGD